jgi:hypothetical protein
MEKQELITSFKKNSFEEIRVSIQDYKGRRYLSLWCWFKSDDDNWQPTKKGLTISLDLLGDLKKAIDAALAKVEFEEEAKAGEQAGENKPEEKQSL